MAAHIENNLQSLRNEIIRQQIAFFAIQLVALNNVKQAADFKFTNDKINEDKSYTNLLLEEVALVEIIKHLNFRVLELLQLQQKVEDLSSEESKRMELIHYRMMLDDDFFIRLENEKNLIIKNQMLLDKIIETEKQLQIMIYALDQRNVVLDTEIAANNIDNKNMLGDIFRNINYNEEPKEFVIGGKTIRFEAQEMMNALNDKLNEKIDNEILTKDNFFSEAKNSYREVIEEKFTSEDYDRDDFSHEIDELVEHEFAEIQQQILNSSGLKDFQNGIDNNQALISERNINKLLIERLENEEDNLHSARNNIEAQKFTNSREFALESAILEDSLKSIAVLQIASDPLYDLLVEDDLLQEDEEEINFDDDNNQPPLDEESSNARASLPSSSREEKIVEMPQPAGGASENSFRAKEPPSAPNNNDMGDKAKAKSSTAKLQAIFGKPIAPAAEKDSEVKHASADENKSQPSPKQPAPSNLEPSSEEKKQEEEYKPRGPGFG